MVPCVVEGLAHGADLAVHHAAEAEQVGSRLRLREPHGAVAVEGAVVVDHAIVVEDAAVAVVGELVEAQVGLDDERVADLLDRDARGDVEDAVGVARAGALGVADGRDAEQHHAADPRLGRLDERAAQAVERVLGDAGHGGDGRGLREALAHEHRQHQVGGVQARLRREPTHRRGRAEAARTVVGGGHSVVLRSRRSARPVSPAVSGRGSS